MKGEPQSRAVYRKPAEQAGWGWGLRRRSRAEVWGGGGPHHFVLVEHQPIVVRHETEAVPPFLVVLLVLEEVPREDDALIQWHLRVGWSGE